ncbi:MAG: Catalase [Cytophagaceae bacterium]|jgi:catalase|nr:Catalase [Cytophagaceae bacterium]
MPAAKSIKGKTIAILIADGVNDHLLNLTKHELEAHGADTRFVALQPGSITAAKRNSIAVDYAIHTVAQDAFDGLYIPGGKRSLQTLISQKEVLDFVCSMYSGGKHIAVDDEAMSLLEAACLNPKLSSLNHVELRTNGIFVHTNTIPAVKHFVKAIAADHPLPDNSFDKQLKDEPHYLVNK